MKITKEQIRSLDQATLINAIDWLFDSNKRLDLAGSIGHQSKIKAEYNRSLAACRRHCLEMMIRLAEYASGRADCADEIDLMTCPRCDCCGWPVIENCGDEYSILCHRCSGVCMTGQDAVDYINKKATQEVK